MPILKPLSFATLAALSLGAWADDSPISFSGFGTVGVVQTNTNDGQYRISARPPSGADKSASFDVDTKLGLQVSGKLSPSFSLTAQLLVEQDDQNRYRPEPEWVFAKYDITPALSVRAGRVGLPAFLISDFRKVGYANVWVRPPTEVYGQVPFSTLDGADVIWRIPTGDNTLTFQPYVGQSKFDLAGDTKGKGKNLYGMNVSYEVGSLLLRAGYLKSKLTLENNDTRALFAAMRSVPLPGWAAAAGELESVGKDASFTGVGAIWDDGKLLLQSEFTQRRTKGFVEDTDGWYATGGYRFGDFTPYLSYAKVKTKHRSVAESLFAPTPQLVGLRAAAISGQAGADQKAASVGLRWNAYKNMDIKGQFDRVKTEVGKDNFFAHQAPGFAGKSVNVYSLAVDFIF
ncbi:porin [Chitinimonas naiadis]